MTQPPFTQRDYENMLEVATVRRQFYEEEQRVLLAKAQELREALHRVETAVNESRENFRTYLGEEQDLRAHMKWLGYDQAPSLPHPLAES